MPMTAADTWHSLLPAWQQAFEQAWLSRCEGNLGIGAVLVDPADGSTVSVGRNQVGRVSPDSGPISGNFMAHAEMNALAAMTRYKANGLHLYTTLEPCLMCAATTVFLHVERVHFAAADEFFDGVHDLWDGHPYSSKWKPDRIGPLDAGLAAFARVLPLSLEAANHPRASVLFKAQESVPAVAALAVELAADGTLDRVGGDGGTVLDALESLWPRLPR